MNSKLASDIRKVIRFYPFNDMSDLTKTYIHRLADRAYDLEEELEVYREAFRAVGEVQLKQAKHLARMRHAKETGPDQLEG